MQYEGNMAKAKKLAKHEHPFLSMRNVKWLGAGAISIIIGYIALAQGPYDNPLSITVAPIFLAIGYCILIPVGLAIHPVAPKPVAPKKENAANE
jgi:hypothetical protein